MSFHSRPIKVTLARPKSPCVNVSLDFKSISHLHTARVLNTHLRKVLDIGGSNLGWQGSAKCHTSKAIQV